MFRRNNLDTLSRLISAGNLKLVYIIGIARSNSTVVSRVLGERLDGVVYEPAVPSAMMPRRHYARTILRAYDKALKTRPGPITLAVKDISLFLDDEHFDFIARHAAHVVFTLRDPACAHRSLVKQFRQEFRFWQRVDAIINEPFEALWMALQFAHEVPRLGNAARRATPGQHAPWYRRAMGGWTLESWQKIERQFAKLDPSCVTVLDADEARRAPAEAMTILANIAGRLMPEGRRPTIEIAAHSRMYTRSKWANEARASAGIKPASAVAPAAVGDAPFERALLEQFSETYMRLISSPANPLRMPVPVEASRTAAA